MNLHARSITKRLFNQPARIARACSGYTLIELLVAMTVFGVALSGLMPLVAILSRDLQPQIGQKGTSPARDWNDWSVGECPADNHQRTTWHLTPYGDPWMRKLGASAQLDASGTVTSSTPLPVQSPVLVQDDSDAAFTSNGMTPVSPGGYNGGYQKIEAATNQELAAVATWTFTVAADGWYSIQATWPTDTGLSLTYARYQVVAPAQTIDPPNLDQGNPGSDFNDASSSASGPHWWPITSVYLHRSDTVTVTLNVPTAASSNLFVIADALAIVQNAANIESLERSFGRNDASGNPQPDVTAKASITVSMPP
jgi:prepilin-type N-terminal cleavage/methylation domain-containing protein